MAEFTNFVLKVAGRCNLNCSYCYMYKLFDQTWTKQPTHMSAQVWEAAARQIHAHLQVNAPAEATILLHGGEPLLLGKRRMYQLLSEYERLFSHGPTAISYVIQSNGTLLDQEWIDLFYHFGVEVGLSLDGDRATHDARRVDYLGRGSYDRVRQAIELLHSTAQGRAVFGGVLTVVDLASDPLALLRHAQELGIHTMNFLLPDSNHECYPAGKAHFADTSYGDWLIALFDAHADLDDARPTIHLFDTLMELLQFAEDHPGVSTAVSDTGIVVESNGALHAMDTWKVSAETDLGLNVFDHSLAEAGDKELIRLQMTSDEGLSQACRDCSELPTCRGGPRAHRFSRERGYANPGVYCADWFKLIRHIKAHRARHAEAALCLV